MKQQSKSNAKFALEKSLLMEIVVPKNVVLLKFSTLNLISANFYQHLLLASIRFTRQIKSHVDSIVLKVKSSQSP
jgi:hypothetical protein